MLRGYFYRTCKQSWNRLKHFCNSTKRRLPGTWRLATTRFPNCISRKHRDNGRPASFTCTACLKVHFFFPRPEPACPIMSPQTNHCPKRRPVLTPSQLPVKQNSPAWGTLVPGMVQVCRHAPPAPLPAKRTYRYDQLVKRRGSPPLIPQHRYRVALVPGNRWLRPINGIIGDNFVPFDPYYFYRIPFPSENKPGPDPVLPQQLLMHTPRPAAPAYPVKPEPSHPNCL
jgi:hypothetical protein